MANLKEIAELAWKQLFPNPGDETKITREQFIATAKAEYATLMWARIKEDKRENGTADVPSYLLTEVDIDVKDNIMDISDLKILRSIDLEMWLQNIGGIGCDCQYIKSTHNHSKILCDDDSLPDSAKTYYPLGKKIIFPRGVHKSPLSITYANNGENIDEDFVEIDDAIGGLLRRSLVEIYGGKTGKEDKTDNSNPET